VVGGDVMRLNKETGGFFPPADEPITFEQTIHFYMSGNQCGASKLSAVEY
jgi:glycine reductase